MRLVYVLQTFANQKGVRNDPVGQNSIISGTRSSGFKPLVGYLWESY